MKVPGSPLLWSFWLLLAGVCHGVLVDLQRYQRLIVNVHNRYRANERAANMKALTWDPYLQRRAAEWSENCYWGHQGKGLGENLATFWTTGPQMAVADIIVKSCQNWWKEIYDWSWSTSCGSACHYTQMIWAKTERIGCSLSKCQNMGSENGGGMQNSNYFVCFYDPPGNFMGQYPYIRGPSCSQCSPGDICVSGLCSSPSRRRATPRRRIRMRRPVSRRRITYRYVPRQSRYIPAQYRYARVRYVPLQSRRTMTHRDRESYGEAAEAGEGPSEGYTGGESPSGGENLAPEGTAASEL